MGKDEDEKIPSVQELEALEQQDRKATEQLLSGFDRPGRTPRTPRVRSRDFVDYYSGRGAAVPDAPPPSSKRVEPEPHQRATVLIPRRQGFRTTMTWVVAVAGMVLFGVTIAVLATPQAPPSSVSSPSVPPPSVSPPSIASPTMAPTSATTITSANPQPVDTGEPDTVADSVITAPLPSTLNKKTMPSTTITGGASSAAPIKTAPRADFIRDM